MIEETKEMLLQIFGRSIGSLIGVSIGAPLGVFIAFKLLGIW